MKAVVLARGLGTRMRAPDDRAALDPGQAAAADRGLKAMIPTAAGRPFLDYVLSGLADAGWDDVCLVVGPEHGAVREHYARVALRRLRVQFAVQARPLGTADAVLAAEAFTAGEPFLVLNADNYYPVAALRALGALDEPGLAGFGRRALVADGLIPANRIAQFAVLDVAGGYLRRVIEKPDAATLRAFGDDALISMNVWRFTSQIFSAAREIRPSARGELEIPMAVQHAIDRHGARFRVLSFQAGVLDLSSRGDVAVVAGRLRDVPVTL